MQETSSVLTQVLESDENLFHLKTEYLESLGIKLPLTNWVTVTNVSLNFFYMNYMARSECYK